MGLWSYLFNKIIPESKVSDSVTTDLSYFKYVVISGSLALVLFGVGYVFHGIGSVAKPISEIIDELNDSSDNTDIRKTRKGLHDIELEELVLTQEELEKSLNSSDDSDDI